MTGVQTCALPIYPEEFAALAASLKGAAKARAVEGDGYRELKRLMPPPERRGVVLIDPPFESENEFADAARALIEEHRRFATGIYLFWYPAKSMASVAAAAGEMMNAGMTSLLKVELDVGAPPEPVAEGRGPKLSATGLLIVNPPYGFADEMKSLLPYLARHLSQGPNAACTVAWLAGGE